MHTHTHTHTRTRAHTHTHTHACTHTYTHTPHTQHPHLSRADVPRTCIINSIPQLLLHADTHLWAPAGSTGLISGPHNHLAVLKETVWAFTNLTRTVFSDLVTYRIAGYFRFNTTGKSAFWRKFYMAKITHYTVCNCFEGHIRQDKHR